VIAAPTVDHLRARTAAMPRSYVDVAGRLAAVLLQQRFVVGGAKVLEGDTRV
jgi:hypothetical protein